MKNGITSIALALLGLVSTGAAASMSWDLIKSETGNHCIDQGLGHLRYLFGEDFQLTSRYVEYCHSGDANCRTWIQTTLCDGHFVIEAVRGSSCSIAHYGFVPMYVRRIWAFGNCRQILPEDVYPRNDNTDAYIRRPK